MITQYFRSITAGATTVLADTHGSDLQVIAGTNITLTADPVLGQLTIGTSPGASFPIPITQDNSTNATNYVVFNNASSGDLSPRTDTDFYYNPATGVLAVSAIRFGDTTIASTASEAFAISNFNFKIAGDDSTQRTISLNETVQFVGTGGIGVTTDAEGKVTITTSPTPTFTSVTTPSVTAPTTNLNFYPVSTGNVIVNQSSGGAYGLVLAQDPSTPQNSARLFFDSNVNVASIRNNAGGGLAISTGATIGSTSGAIQFQVSPTASAVNYVQATGGATGVAPTISAQGSDAAVDLTLNTKSTGTIRLQSNSTTRASINAGGTVALGISASGGSGLQVIATSNQVNFTTVSGSITGQIPTLSMVNSSDTNVGLGIVTKGTGAIDLAAGSSGVNISNGGTVTAITRTVTGSNYTSFPSVAISAPTTAGGVQATAAVQKLGAGNAISIANGGTGYTLNDVITLVGGTPGTVAATYTVTAVSSGVITAVSALNFADYTVLPTAPTSVTGGTGTGATLNIGYYVAFGQPVITNAGSGYIEQPTVTFSGGGGSGAAAYARVGSGTVFKTLGSNVGFYTPGGPAFEVGDLGTTTVDYVSALGGTGGVYLGVAGSSANPNLYLSTKGTGAIQFFTNGQGATRQFNIAHTASAVNYVQVTGSITGTAVQLLAAGSDTNIPIALQPKGTGALQAQKTDSTAVGGNARGANATDWQTGRGSASQVASGQWAVVSGGTQNTASAFTTTVGGGFQNNAAGYSSTIAGGTLNTGSGAHVTIAGGFQNTASQFFGFVGGGYQNNATGYYNVIGGGQSNSGTANAAVTTQAGTANATTTLTLSGSNAAIKIGQYITGTYIATNTYVTAISGTTLTLSQAASGSGAGTLSFYTPHGVVVGGGNNQATGSYSFIGGGGDAGTAANRNVASGDWSFVGGGAKNTASNSGAIVCGGGTNGSVVGGNTASGQYSAVVSGFSCTSSGEGSFVGNGYANVSNGQYSFIGAGTRGNARSIAGNHVFPAHANPIADAAGINQSALLILGRQTTDATPTVLASSSSAAGTTNQVILPNNSAYYFRGTVVAGVTGGGDTKGWFIEGVIKRGANAAATALVGTATVTSNYADAGASAWAIAVTANTTNGGLAVTFTGQASTTIRCVAKIETTEMTF